MADTLSAYGRNSIRGWLGASFLVGAYLVFDPIESAIHVPIANAFGLHMISHGHLRLLSYGALMTVRLCLDLLVVAGVLAILRHQWVDFPLTGRELVRPTLLGLGTGFLVMTSAIMAIVWSGNAAVAPSMQTTASSALYGTGWLVFDYLGAAGEELYGRVAVLLVAQSLIGKRGAILASGLMFSILHLGNPGADWIWLLRLFIQGALLAYAVYRTGSIWWSIGYHTGWNWASAPLFGAAGSGFLDQGHVLDFKPLGSPLITGGAIGPEGSIFAFLAVLVAFGVLVTTSPDRPGSRASLAVKAEDEVVT